MDSLDRNELTFIKKQQQQNLVLLIYKLGSKLTDSFLHWERPVHYSDVMMSTMASQITGVSVVYSTFCLDEDKRKHPRSA